MIQKIPMLPDCIFNSLQFILPCSSVPVNLKSSRFFFDKRHGIVILFGPSADVSLCRFLDKSGGSIYPAFNCTPAKYRFSKLLIPCSQFFYKVLIRNQLVEPRRIL